MRVLCVAEDVPTRDPVHGDGSSMISYEVLLALPVTFEVTLVTFDRGFPVPPEIRDRCADVVLLPLAPRRWPRRLPALRHLGARARTTSTARHVVAERSRAADVTLVHGPLALGLARSVGGPLVVQTVDPWSRALASVAAATHGPRRAYWSFRARTTALVERTLPRRARLLTVGEADARAWSDGLGRPVRAVANGVHVRPRRPRAPHPPTLCFVGSLGYPPNAESAHRLVRDVLPLVRHRVGDARVVVAGRHPRADVAALAAAGVEVRADVPDVAEVFDDADVAVFCDRRGTGVRNAVQEALASGLPVVATPVAARGLAAHPACRLAETDEDLAAAVCAALGGAGPGTAPAGPLRSWTACAAEYADELSAAVEAATQPPGGRHRRAARRLRT